MSDNPVLLSYGYLEEEDNIQTFFYKNGVATERTYETITDSEIWQQFVLIHLDIPVNFICCNTAKDKEEFLTRFTKKVPTLSSTNLCLSWQ